MWGLLPPFSTAVTALVLGAALGLLRSKVFRVFPLDDQIFRNVIWVLLHSHNRTFLKTGYSISSTSIRGKVWNANLRLLEEVDAFFDPLTELLLRFLPLSQIPFRQHLLHLGRKRRKFNFYFFCRQVLSPRRGIPGWFLAPFDILGRSHHTRLPHPRHISSPGEGKKCLEYVLSDK